MLEIKNYIGGVFQPAMDGEVLEDFNPATAECVATIPRSKVTDVELAVLAAQSAQSEWGALSMLERADWLDRIADALEAKHEHIAQTESMDTGKPISLARRVDASRSVSNFRFFAEFSREQSEMTFEMADAMNYVHRSPLGTVGLITPWNLPLYLLSWKVAPALLMGNTIVAKPSEITPLTANVLAETLHELKLPPGVFNLVHGLGPEVGQSILEAPEIKGISFTGGTATGRIVARTAAPMFKKLSLELGGKNATIVLRDADLSQAVDGAVRAAFTNSGQVCLCGSRILVDASIADAFTKLFIEKVESIQIGNPSLDETVMGSVISPEHLEKVESYIELGLAEGGTVLTGGTREMTGFNGPNGVGAFLRPTVVADLPHTSRCATEEIFGPMVTLHTFDSEEQAVEMANHSEYGLAGSVWTTDLERGRDFATKIETGIVWVNTWLHRDLRTPFGGMKNSGVGREGGKWSMEFFSEMTNVCVKFPNPSK
ncbi:MAG: aldehyde dehydrogenase [Euryarchaeota archaeon]|jgi:aminomuconate-semialdehyde/2-hydroxymuconate-6-semialdehyde dehydrogenase|nr:aldehyde dehydrogenase [Euryarchaeota archaeon]